VAAGLGNGRTFLTFEEDLVTRRSSPLLLLSFSFFFLIWHFPLLLFFSSLSSLRSLTFAALHPCSTSNLHLVKSPCPNVASADPPWELQLQTFKVLSVLDLVARSTSVLLQALALQRSKTSKLVFLSHCERREYLGSELVWHDPTWVTDSFTDGGNMYA